MSATIHLKKKSRNMLLNVHSKKKLGKQFLIIIFFTTKINQKINFKKDLHRST